MGIGVADESYGMIEKGVILCLIDRN